MSKILQRRSPKQVIHKRTRTLVWRRGQNPLELPNKPTAEVFEIINGKQSKK